MRWNVPPLRIGSAVTHAAIVMVAPKFKEWASDFPRI